MFNKSFITEFKFRATYFTLLENIENWMNERAEFSIYRKHCKHVNMIFHKTFYDQHQLQTLSNFCCLETAVNFPRNSISVFVKISAFMLTWKWEKSTNCVTSSLSLSNMQFIHPVELVRTEKLFMNREWKVQRAIKPRSKHIKLLETL